MIHSHVPLHRNIVNRGYLIQHTPKMLITPYLQKLEVLWVCSSMDQNQHESPVGTWCQDGAHDYKRYNVLVIVQDWTQLVVLTSLDEIAWMWMKTCQTNLGIGGSTHRWWGSPFYVKPWQVPHGRESIFQNWKWSSSSSPKLCLIIIDHHYGTGENAP